MQEILDKPEEKTGPGVKNAVSAPKAVTSESSDKIGKKKEPDANVPLLAAEDEVTISNDAKNSSLSFFPSLNPGESQASFFGKSYGLITVGHVKVDHSCMPLLRRGDWFGHRNDFSEDLDATGWMLGCNLHLPIWSFLDLDSSVSYTLASVEDGVIIHHGKRKAFDDSDCQFIQGRLLLQHSFFPDGAIRPYVGAGVQFFFSKIEYDRGITYWYWVRSKNISRVARNSGGDSIDDTEIAPCVNLGFEWVYSKFAARAEVIYSTGMKDVWRHEDSDDEENLVIAADCRYSISDQTFLQAGVCEFKATAVKDVHIGLGAFF